MCLKAVWPAVSVDDLSWKRAELYAPDSVKTVHTNKFWCFGGSPRTIFRNEQGEINADTFFDYACAGRFGRFIWLQ